MIRYRPFLDGPHHLAMGLKALDPAAWLERDDTYEGQLAEKRRLLATRRDEVVAALPASLPAQREAAARLLAHLEHHLPDGYRFAPDAVHDRVTGERFVPAEFAAMPLELAARLIQEDLCLFEASPDGYRLSAAVVAFPARWRLADKIGRPLPAIHAPVPGYAERLATPVDRLFASLRAKRPVWRVNWSLVDTQALFLPPEARAATPVAEPARLGETMWLRVERQTLTRLPESAAVLFTIRTYVDPLEDAIDGPVAAAALAARLREMPDPLAGYKVLTWLRPALLGWLERRAQAGSGLPTAG